MRSHGKKSKIFSMIEKETNQASAIFDREYENIDEIIEIQYKQIREEEGGIIPGLVDSIGDSSIGSQESSSDSEIDNLIE